MRLDEMKPPPKSRRPKKRRGRGPGSGLGKTAGKGHKGARARAGRNVKPGFEGGQMPLARRLPKRGFRNFTRVEYQVVNLAALQRFEPGSSVDPATLVAAGLARKNVPVKILAKGEIKHGLNVRAHAFSKTAHAAIEQAGGTVEVVAFARSTRREKHTGGLS